MGSNVLVGGLRKPILIDKLNVGQLMLLYLRDSDLLVIWEKHKWKIKVLSKANQGVRE